MSDNRDRLLEAVAQHLDSHHHGREGTHNALFMAYTAAVGTTRECPTCDGSKTIIEPSTGFEEPYPCPD